MSIDVHTVAQHDGSVFSKTDRVSVVNLPGVANVIGGGAGLSVTTAIALKGLPAKYTVNVTPNQDATAWVTGKTATGFNVVLAPRLAASTLAVGTFDVQVIY